MQNQQTPSRVAIVTGAGTGVGKASALALLKAGFFVFFAGRRTEVLEQAINEAGKLSNSALAVQTDVGVAASVQGLFQRVQEKFGRLDLLFNNAGMGAPAIPLEDLTVDQWNAVVAANITGPFLCTQQAFRIMKMQSPMGGRIINNGSISATVPRPNSSPYTATKHAMTGLTKATSLDGRKYDIAVSQIDIGNAHTDMTERMRNGIVQANGTIMIEPTFDVEHVAQAVVTIANMPLDTNVQFMTIMATKMPFIGRG